MLEVPGNLTLLFILTTLATYVLFILTMMLSPTKSATRYGNIVAICLLLWLMFQSTLSLNKWYMDRLSTPPHMAFPLISSIIVIAFVMLTPRGKMWIRNLSLPMLTWLHIVRIPVEICLYWLALSRQLPWSMTFDGYNFDILFGITAPLMALFYFKWKKISARAMVIWNVLGLISVLAVVIRGVGALPSPIQMWDFEQPNFAVMHFPFIWLPAFIVPLVVLSHLIAIRRFRKNEF